MISPRQQALIALRDVHMGAYADVALDRVLQKADLPDRDRRLVTELLYGSVRRVRTLDAIIDQLAKKKSHQQPLLLRTILHLGLYQLQFQQRIPSSAAVNTTVQLAKDNGFSGLSGFVNGLLRQYIRLGEEVGEHFTIPLKLPENPVKRLGILHSFPDWIVSLWLEQFGFSETEKLCEWMNQTPSIDLRVNQLRSCCEEVETALQNQGILSERIPSLPHALRLLSHPGSIKNLPGFNQGWWTIQDSSAQLVSYLLNPQQGEVIIDACAAPGGKTTHIAELIGDTGKIWACDRTDSRLRKLQQNTQRLNLNSIQICVGDTRNFTQFQNSADKVLLDVPCSGLGTLHRHADARFRQTPESVEELSTLQKELLLHSSTFLKDNGSLVYSTCTLHPLENEGVIKWFLESHPNWEIEPPDINSPIHDYSTNEGWIKVLPHKHNMDGFFMVRLRKKHN
ncbi:16S rRNA (cytosine(967)-C(5))-methyltransferase [Plectonema cf. radiosum LEGE 06105]|uniref:16S rRNA (cytosine(967)-C(5))-methyltransferase n=1 Tax=Plectonema cf. radiosum LEGE 06105 TaxID=945769 RepID=A0A8J7K4G3_9CYAN|nr:16S rRNA (cytosine(967)-C(5))-methyltransferase [Plectonema radiosum]MBE9217066.1 16S rRNA (cytosine(967)-C(5))-methyltransferase [Plectonema cf. radiosum LEGE 06105]